MSRQIRDIPGGGGGRSGTGSYAAIPSGKRQSAPSAVKTAAATSSAIAPSPIKLGVFCHFCEDYADDRYHQCEDCRAIVCQQKARGTTGCIGHGTVKPNTPFFCPLCSRKSKNNAKVLYVHHGFINRRNAKLCWPMCLVHIKLEALMDWYASDVTNLEAQYRYAGFLENLFMAVLQMKKGAQNHERNKMSGGCDLIVRSIKEKLPANVFIIIDTHSEEHSGMLQHCGGNTPGAAKFATVREIIEGYLGKDFMSAMQNTSDAARNSSDKEVRGNSWYDDRAYTRGGWRGVFLISCGPAVKPSFHYDTLITMVEENIVDFVVGFSASSTLPCQVLRTIQTCIWDVGLNGKSDIWSTFCKMMAENEEILFHTSPVVIYSTMVDGRREVRARQIARHTLPWRAFGIEFQACGGENCNPPKHRMIVKGSSAKFHVVCTVCKWRSANLKMENQPPYLYQVNRVTSPLIFWHSYPPAPGLLNLFVDAKRKSKQPSDMSIDDEAVGEHVDVDEDDVDMSTDVDVDVDQEEHEDEDEDEDTSD